MSETLRQRASTMLRRAAGGIALVAALGAAQPAAAKSPRVKQAPTIHENAGRPGAPDACRGTAANKVARMLESRLVHHEPITYNADHQLYWTTPNARADFKYRSNAPAVAKVGSKTCDFALIQHGKRLDTINVTPIPEHAAIVDGPYAISPDPAGESIWGVPHPIESTHGVLHLNANHQPYTVLRYEDGDHARVEIGQTVTVNTNAIVF